MKTIVSIGLVCLDIIIRGILDVVEGDKQPANIAIELGGGAANVASTVESLNGDCRLVTAVGDDSLGRAVPELIHAQLANSVIVPCLEQTRVSVIDQYGSIRHTPRRPMEHPRFRRACETAVANADIVYLAPGSADDYDFIEDLARTARFAFLALSKEQLQDTDAALTLMRAAKCTQLNASELKDLTNIHDAKEALQHLHELGAQNVVATSRGTISAVFDGELLQQPSFVVDDVAKFRHGDSFTGGFLYALSDGKTAQECLEFGAATAASWAQHGRTAGVENVKEFIKNQASIQATGRDGATAIGVVRKDHESSQKPLSIASSCNQPSVSVVLVVAAHCDDELLGCGAMIAELAGSGIPVYVAILAAANAARRRESEAAVTSLGVPASQLFLYDFPDGNLSAMTVAISDVLRVIDSKVCPDLVVTHRADMHRDHVAVFEAVRQVFCWHGVSILTFSVPQPVESGFRPAFFFGSAKGQPK